MQTILTFLLTSTLFLAISGVVLWLLTRLGRFRSSRLTQIAWCLVLLQGIVVFRWPVDLPLLVPEENRTYSSQTRVTFFPPRETAIPRMQDATPQPPLLCSRMRLSPLSPGKQNTRPNCSSRSGFSA